MPSKEVLVVIPCLNEVDHIEAIITYAVGSVANPSSLIVVADGGSTDGSLEIIKNCCDRYDQVRLFNNTQRLQSAAINSVVAHYGDRFEYIVRLDAHAEYPENFIDQLVKEADSVQADSVVVTMRTVGASVKQRLVAIAQSSPLGNGGSPHRNRLKEGRWVEHGHHALMRIDAFREVGGYDETFSHNEDAELDCRLVESGRRIWLTATTDMTYFPRARFRALFQQYRNYGRGRAKNSLKHHRMPGVRQLVLLSVFPAFILWLFCWVHWVFAIPFAAWLALTLGAGVIVGARSPESLRSRFFVGIPAATMHFAWSFGFLEELGKLEIRLPNLRETKRV